MLTRSLCSSIHSLAYNGLKAMMDMDKTLFDTFARRLRVRAVCARCAVWRRTVAPSSQTLLSQTTQDRRRRERVRREERWHAVIVAAKRSPLAELLPVVENPKVPQLPRLPPRQPSQMMGAL